MFDLSWILCAEVLAFISMKIFKMVDFTILLTRDLQLKNHPEKMDKFLITAQELQNVLGDDYLLRLQRNFGHKISEIIIAEEFQRDPITKS